MYEKAAVLFLYAETPVHPGAGAGIGLVDLPVQREVQTDLPIMYGSGLKGSLKDAVKLAPAVQTALFGKESVEGEDDHNSALSFVDAQVLAFPVKAARDLFGWVTCPRQVALLNRALVLAGLPALGGVPATLADDRCLVPPGYPAEHVILEDNFFRKAGEHALAPALLEWLFAPDDDWYRQHFIQSLVVVSDEVFRHFTTRSTEVRTRVRIDDETGVVQTGMLWTEEYLPADTILFAELLAARPVAGVESAAAALAQFAAAKPAVAQFGGNETVGKGFMRVTVCSGEASHVG